MNQFWKARAMCTHLMPCVLLLLSCESYWKNHLSAAASWQEQQSANGDEWWSQRLTGTKDDTKNLWICEGKSQAWIARKHRVFRWQEHILWTRHQSSPLCEPYNTKMRQIYIFFSAIIRTLIFQPVGDAVSFFIPDKSNSTQVFSLCFLTKFFHSWFSKRDQLLRSLKRERAQPCSSLKPRRC